MKELLYEFKNQQTINLGGRKRRYVQYLSPSFKIFRDGNTISHETRQGSIRYLVPNGYEGKVTNGNWEDIFRNVNKKTFSYEIEHPFDLDLQDNQESIDTLVDVDEADIMMGLVEKRKFNGLKVPEGRKVVRAEEILNFRRQDSRIVNKLRAIRGFDGSGNPVKVKSISRLGSKINIEFEKEVAIIDPQWSDQPDATDGKDALLYLGGNYETFLCFETGRFGGDVRRGIIEFVAWKDEIPEGCTITSAIMELLAYDREGRWQNITCEAHRNTEAWVEDEVTSVNQPDHDTPTATVSVTSTGWKSFDVTTLFQGIYIETYTDYGMKIKSQSEGTDTGYPSWYSSDHLTAGNRPKITVDYEILPIEASATVGLKLNESSVLKTIFNPVVTGGLNLSESSASKTYYNIGAVDSLKLNEVAVKDFYLSIIDYLKVNDLPEVICSFNLTLSDSLNINELLDSLNIELSENLSISDVAQSLGHYFMSISENFKIEDVNVTYRWGKVYFSFRVRNNS